MAHENPSIESHPFLDFRFRLDLPPLSFWATLGECSAAIEQVIGAALRPDTAARINAAHLSGTMSVGETILPSSVENTSDDFSLAAVRSLHRAILGSREGEGEPFPGELRKGISRVADYRSPEPEHTARLLERAAEWLNHPDWRKEYGGRFVMPILRAVLAHLYLAWIRPFDDGNGRIARVMEFHLLRRAGVPAVSARLLSDHYDRARSSYYLALSDARQSPAAFVEYAIEGLRERLRDQLEEIRASQREVAWADFVRTSFKPGSETRAVERQRRVLLALGALRQPVPASDIARLDHEVSAMYGRVQPRMVALDLAALADAGLIHAEGGMVQAAFELVQPFLRTAPPTTPPP